MQRNEAAILVVDDDAKVRDALCIRLSAAGFSVKTAADGAEAVACCVSDPPDVIILDVSMPGMDGFQVCERIRREVDAPQMAIVFLTGTTHAGTSSCMQQLVDRAGGDYFIAKPYDADLLLDLLDSIVRDLGVSVS